MDEVVRHARTRAIARRAIAETFDRNHDVVLSNDAQQEFFRLAQAALAAFVTARDRYPDEIEARALGDGIAEALEGFAPDENRRDEPGYTIGWNMAQDHRFKVVPVGHVVQETT